MASCSVVKVFLHSSRLASTLLALETTGQAIPSAGRTDAVPLLQFLVSSELAFSFPSLGHEESPPVFEGCWQLGPLREESPPVFEGCWQLGPLREESPPVFEGC